MRVRTGIAFRQQREPALACRETRFLRVEILGLRERNRRVNRSRIGNDVAAAVDGGEIDPAAKRQCDTLVADFSGRTRIECRWCRLVSLRHFIGSLLGGSFGLRFKFPFFPALALDALLQLLQLGLEQTNLGRCVLLCDGLLRDGLLCEDLLRKDQLREDLARRNQNAANNNAFEFHLKPPAQEKANTIGTSHQLRCVHASSDGET